MFARDKTLGIVAEVDVDIAALDALDLPHDQAALAIRIGIDDLAALGFAHFLHDDLLGGLRGDATKFDRVDLLFDKITELDFGLIDLRGFERNLAQRLFEPAIFSRLDHFPAPVGIVVTGLAIDIDTNLDVFLVLLARCRSERRFDRFKNNFAIDTFLVGDGIRY